MKIPARIKIMGFEWAIEKDKSVAAEGSVFGSTHTHSQKIFLDPTTTQQKNEQTLVHEILHAIAWQTGLARRLEKFSDNKIEEEIIQSLSFALYEVLKENKLHF